MTNKCTICGEPMPDDVPFRLHGYDGNDCPKPPMYQNVVAVESGIRRRRDGAICFYVGKAEIECSSMQEAERMFEDLNAMVHQSGGSTLARKGPTMSENERIAAAYKAIENIWGDTMGWEQIETLARAVVRALDEAQKVKTAC